MYSVHVFCVEYKPVFDRFELFILSMHTAEDCYHIGRSAYNNEDFYHTRDWMKEALRSVIQHAVQVSTCPHVDTLHVDVTCENYYHCGSTCTCMYMFIYMYMYALMQQSYSHTSWPSLFTSLSVFFSSHLSSSSSFLFFSLFFYPLPLLSLPYPLSPHLPATVPPLLSPISTSLP